MQKALALGKAILFALAALLLLNCDGSEVYSVAIAGSIQAADGKALANAEATLTILIYDHKDDYQPLTFRVSTSPYGWFSKKISASELPGFFSTKTDEDTPLSLNLVPYTYVAQLSIDGGETYDLIIESQTPPDETLQAKVVFAPLHLGEALPAGSDGRITVDELEDPPVKDVSLEDLAGPECFDPRTCDEVGHGRRE